MMLENNISSLQKKGFHPVSRTKEFTLLKASKGMALAYEDDSMEGFVRSESFKESLEEINLREAVSLLFLIGASMTYFTTDVTIIKGESMAPTFHSGQILVRSKSPKSVEKILVQRDSIIKFRAPDGKTCVKRVMGLPHDEIESSGDGSTVLRINGKNVYTDYTLRNKEDPPRQTDKYFKFSHNAVKHKLKSGQYFVVGDNSTRSEDSRTFGLIEGINIISVIDK